MDMGAQVADTEKYLQPQQRGGDDGEDDCHAGVAVQIRSPTPTDASGAAMLESTNTEVRAVTPGDYFHEGRIYPAPVHLPRPPSPAV
jgi:hypothetical protein